MSKESNKSVPIKPNGEPIRKLEKVEIADSFTLEADKLLRVTFADQSIVYVLCTINGVPVVLSDCREEFTSFLSQFVKD